MATCKQCIYIEREKSHDLPSGVVMVTCKECICMYRKHFM